MTTAGAGSPRPWTLTGRSEELSFLEAAFTEDGVRHVTVAGAAGVGKSRLVQEARAWATARGWDTELAVGTRSASSMLFAAVAHLLPAAAAVGATGPAELLARLAAVLGERASQRPLMLVVDDAHLLDDGSAALVHHLAVRSRVRVLASVRTGETCPDPVTALWKDGLAARLELQPISVSEVGLLLEHALGGPVASPTSQLLARVTGGNPMFLRELVHAGLADGRLARPGRLWRWDGPLHPGQRLIEILGARIAALDARQRDALELLAVGEPLGPAALGHLVAPEVLAELEQAALVTASREGRRLVMRMAHPLYTEMVRASMSELRLPELKGRLARALEQSGCRRRDDLARLACWAVESGAPVGPARLLAAARQAAAVFDHAAALHLGRAALRSGAGVPASLLVADQHYWLGRFEDSVAVLAGLDSSALAPDQLAHASIMEASAWFWGLGRADEAERILERAVTVLGRPVGYEVAGHRASIALFAGRPVDAFNLAAPILADPSASPTARLRAAMCAPAWLLVGRAEEGAAVAGAYLGLADEHTEDLPLAAGQLVAAVALCQWAAGRITDGMASAAGLCQAAAAREAHDARASFALILGRIQLAAGRVRSAVRSLEEAVDGFRGHDIGRLLPWALAALARARAMCHDAAGAEAALAEADATSVACGVHPFPTERPLAEAWSAAVRGELSRARDLCRDAAVDAARRGDRFAEVLAMHDLAGLGDPDAAASRLTELSGQTEGALVGAMAERARALRDHDGAALDRAAVRLAGVGAILDAAQAAAEAAREHRRGGRMGSAMASAAEAQRLLAGCEGAWAPSVSTLGEVTELRLLTPREREVATLAARGLSSRQIADRLVVSVRTVDNQLARVYSKLGVSGRVDLAPMLG